MNRFKNSHSTDPRLLSWLARPRFLRAVPSVLLLTTAMAWGVGAQAAGGTAVPMGESAVGGLRSDAMGGMSGKTDKGEVKADETVGLKGNVGSVPRKLDKAGRSGAAGGLDAGAGVDAGAAGVKLDADVKAGAGIKGKSPAY
jgi:hypothetical protein